MKKTLAFIFAATAAFAAESAFAVGAVYQVPATVAFTATSSGQSATFTVTGIIRDAVHSQTSTVAAMSAAIAACERANADNSNALRELTESGGGVVISGVSVNITPSTCTSAVNGTFADDEYAAFVGGVTLNASSNDGNFEIYFVINSVRASAIASAAAACSVDYTNSNTCSTDASDIWAYRGQQSSGGGGDDDDDTALYIGGGVVAVGLLAWYFWDGNPLAFSFSPDGDYEMTESGYSYHAGGRMDFRQDEWHLYWTANVGDKGLGYASGGEWQKDIWRAAFSERVAGEVADYNFSLSAKYDGGVWEVAPAYRLHSRLQNGESETDNSLNLEGVLLWNRWAIKPSAGFQWRNAEDFADNAKFGFSAVRNL